MTNKKLLIFDLQGTLVKKMRPPVLNGSLYNLYKLQKKNFIFALFTGASKKETLNIFKKLNLSENLFSNKLIITNNDNFPKKPNPKAITNLIKSLNPSKTLLSW
jgi:hydroxymethylpyrimidine pyrophosphatase-like HAD family hydrolase